MFDLTRYRTDLTHRVHDERIDRYVGVESFYFKSYQRDILLDRICVNFCPPWMYTRIRVEDCDVLLCPHFLMQRGRIFIEVPAGCPFVVEVMPDHCSTIDLLDKHKEQILTHRFQARVSFRDLLL